MGLFLGEARSKLNKSPRVEYYWVMNNSIACWVKLAQWHESIICEIPGQAKLLAVIRDGMNDGYFSRETPGWGTVWSAGWCCIYSAWERHRWLCSLVSRHHRLLTGSLEVGTTLGESEVKFQASAISVGPALGSLWSPGLSSLAPWQKEPGVGSGYACLRSALAVDTPVSC